MAKADLVQRLHALNSGWGTNVDKLVGEAADRIEELERDNQALRAALRGNFTDYADTEDHKQRRIEALERQIKNDVKIICHGSGLNDVSHGLNEVVRLLTLRSMPDENG